MPYCTSSILVAEVREPPDVSQTYNLSHHSQEVLSFARPLAPVMKTVFGGLFPIGETPLGHLVQQWGPLLWR